MSLISQKTAHSPKPTISQSNSTGEDSCPSLPQRHIVFAGWKSPAQKKCNICHIFVDHRVIEATTVSNKRWFTLCCVANSKRIQSQQPCYLTVHQCPLQILQILLVIFPGDLGEGGLHHRHQSRTPLDLSRAWANKKRLLVINMSIFSNLQPNYQQKYWRNMKNKKQTATQGALCSSSYLIVPAATFSLTPFHSPEAMSCAASHSPLPLPSIQCLPAGK